VAVAVAARAGRVGGSGQSGQATRFPSVTDALQQQQSQLLKRMADRDSS